LIRAYAGAFLPASVGMEGPMSHRAPLGPPAAARFHRRRTSGTRDERYRSGTEITPDACFVSQKMSPGNVPPLQPAVFDLLCPGEP
ncbi:hypothetical protein XENOCAPTIV_008552, partial [Xenoophorus captivus]